MPAMRPQPRPRINRHRVQLEQHKFPKTPVEISGGEGLSHLLLYKEEGQLPYRFLDHLGS
ncbi:hypothetical protein BGX23_000284, partial [Mortierella sp. AD031]